MRYNNRAPQENQSMASAWQLLQRPDCAFMDALGSATRRRIRQRMIMLVLATDFAEQAPVLQEVRKHQEV